MDGFKFYRSTRTWGPASRLIQAGNRGNAALNFPAIAHEPTTQTGLTNCDGALSMARLNPGDATTDFFLLLSDIQGFDADAPGGDGRSEEHTSELQSLMRISYAVFCLKKKKKTIYLNNTRTTNTPKNNCTKLRAHRNTI